ncbi:flagellar hook-associated protein FlgL [Bacillus atrophaeus]|jgi:flagellar hook-associated protein 3 FlgL|uniref:Flagellar hook-associated protein FlgL n=1 Tax=Bacillus atrophaeus (strain 1942) TaxID=720555 RepID=A0ABM5M1L0_BACA1|nr:flagellar hook-associated protein FlgL [Bacillus atrophaeus]AMR61272.1 flagellar biosynthesis protein FlgL [Bacillus subtilis subsp. globigii]ADP34038.1 flagellar hook-associated protein FlgL [Bacillus atrophaeus 1942]AIK46954.1 flagellar hook-associated protein 3 [Bacillus atrophaeus subsp. globigii]EIM10946.1 flagellar hook-associated protein FlgL [Bacillus atrophaeus C89]KFK81725.1 flagellar hook-associated protein 3 [Bacillus atrophaeus]
MRVTQGMIQQNSLRYIGSSYAKLDKLQSQVSSGKKISKASDDPIVAMKSLKYNTQLSQVKQYQSNASQAFTWLENTETNITEGIDVLSKVRDLVVKAKNGQNGEAELKSIGVEVNQLKEQLLNIANTQVNGRYIFNGTNSDSPPVVDNGDGTYTISDADDVNVNISSNMTLKVNSDPKSAFGGTSASGQNVFEMLDSLENALNSGSVDDLKSTLSDIDQFTDGMSAERSDIGARYNRLELINTRLETQEETATKVLSDNEDVELEKVITDFIAQASVHRAALAVNAKIVQPTLIDFLK